MCKIGKIAELVELAQFYYTTALHAHNSISEIIDIRNYMITRRRTTQARVNRDSRHFMNFLASIRPKLSPNEKKRLVINNIDQEEPQGSVLGACLGTLERSLSMMIVAHPRLNSIFSIAARQLGIKYAGVGAHLAIMNVIRSNVLGPTYRVALSLGCVKNHSDVFPVGACSFWRSVMVGNDAIGTMKKTWSYIMMELIYETRERPFSIDRDDLFQEYTSVLALLSTHGHGDNPFYDEFIAPMLKEKSKPGRRQTHDHAADQKLDDDFREAVRQAEARDEKLTVRKHCEQTGIDFGEMKKSQARLRKKKQTAKAKAESAASPENGSTNNGQTISNRSPIQVRTKKYRK